MARVPHFLVLAASTVGLAASALGCGSGASVGADGSAAVTGDGAFLTCATDPRAMPYQPGLAFASAAGTYTVKLLVSDPGPPVKGNNTWTLEVDDATGAPVDGLALDASGYMPDHMHGTTPMVVTAAGSGSYTVAPVYLYMSGVWQVTVNLVGAAIDAGTDHAVIPMCIP
jgi:hypothetical protein